MVDCFGTLDEGGGMNVHWLDGGLYRSRRDGFEAITIRV